MNDLKELLQAARARLNNSESARLDAELIISHVLGRDRSWLFTWPEYQPSASELSQIELLLERRSTGEPMAYILGYREFWNLRLTCDQSTLIPRPETEMLVELALSLNLSSTASILDLGTGTGAIALALAKERPHWNIRAIDIQPDAIALAKFNARELQIPGIDWRCGSWFEPLDPESTFDLIISNPPYVEAGSPWLDQGDVRFEPRTALVSGDEGMTDIRHIIAAAKNYLTKGGYLLMEHGYKQAELVYRELGAHGYQSIALHKDLSGLDRATIAAYK